MKNLIMWVPVSIIIHGINIISKPHILGGKTRPVSNGWRCGPYRTPCFGTKKPGNCTFNKLQEASIPLMQL